MFPYTSWNLTDSSCNSTCYIRNVSITYLAIFITSEYSKLGNTDISGIGSTVTGAISNLNGARLVATADHSTYTTYSAQLTYLYGFYQTLSFEQKINSFLESVGVIYSNYVVSSGRYVVVDPIVVDDSSGDSYGIRGQTLGLSDGRFYYYQVSPSNDVRYDYSNEPVGTSELSLYTRWNKNEAPL